MYKTDILLHTYVVPTIFGPHTEQHMAHQGHESHLWCVCDSRPWWVMCCSVWGPREGWRCSQVLTMFSVRYNLRLKKQFSIKIMRQHSTTRWQHSWDACNVRVVVTCHGTVTWPRFIMVSMSRIPGEHVVISFTSSTLIWYLVQAVDVEGLWKLHE